MSATQAEHIASLLKERHNAVKVAFEKLLDALSTADRAQVQQANSVLLKSLQSLSEVIALEHWPKWLKELLAQCKNYETNHSNGKATWRAHLLALFENKAALEEQTWFFDSRESPNFDVDEIIQNARAEFEVDELFDKIIAALTALAACDELDSVKACRDLEQIIAMMRKARAGSFSSQLVTWKFVKRFVPNVLSEYLKSNAVTGPLVSAFERTAEELDLSIAGATDRIAEQVLNVASKTFKSGSLQDFSTDELKKIPNLSEVR